MANLNTVRKRMVTMLVVIGIADVAAITYLLLPSSLRIMAPAAEERRLQTELNRLRDATAPLRNIDKRIQLASTQIDAFKRDRLPDHYSYLVEELGKLASQNKVQLSAVRYKTDETPLADLTQLNMQAELGGDYENLVRFINSVETNRNVFFIIDSIDLAGGKEGAGGSIHLSMKFETFLRNLPPHEAPTTTGTP